MAQIFISYQTRDSEAVRAIAEAIEAEGLTVWWDHALVGGQDYSTVIEREIAAAGAVVVVWSAHAAGSRWVQAEAERAGDKLFPVRIDDASIPLPYNKLHTLDLTRWRGNISDPRWRRLIADLKAILAGARPLRLSDPKPAKQSRLGLYAAASALVLAFGAAAWVWLGQGKPSPAVATAQPAPTTAVSPSSAATPAPSAASPLPPPTPPIADPATPKAPPQTRSLAVPSLAASPAPSVSAFDRVIASLRASAAHLALEICVHDRTPRCGVEHVRVGQRLAVRVTSPISGQLILIDQNASGQQLQIFPNGLSRAGMFAVTAGQTVELPLTNQAFQFVVSEPVGASQLIAIVLPEGAPLPPIIVENASKRGIVAIPTARRDDLADAFYAVIASGKQASVAMGELPYIIDP